VQQPCKGIANALFFGEAVTGDPADEEGVPGNSFTDGIEG